jgi:aspartyl-tRNA(Asn)/glutamyl-tRNA(Gln) amidotransferase subunit B
MAVEYEIKRQEDELAAGRQVVQETRGWSEPDRRTFSQRSKEFAEDYRYFPEPDLPPLSFASSYIEELRSGLPELPAARRERLQADHGLSRQDAAVLSQESAAAEYFDALLARGVEPKLAATWVVNELRQVEGEWKPVEELAEVLLRQQKGEISSGQAKALLAGAGELVDATDLPAIVDRVLAENPQAVADYRAGKQQAIGALIAGVRAATGGTADLKLAAQLLRERVGGGQSTG